MKRTILSRKLSKTEITLGVSTLLVLFYLGWATLDLLRRDLLTHDPRMQVGAIAVNLRILEGAKEQWAWETHQTNGTPVTAADLAPYVKEGQLPKPVAGEVYTITPVRELNTAKLTRKLGNFEAGQVLTVTSF
jgi:hypothetical protein